MENAELDNTDKEQDLKSRTGI